MESMKDRIVYGTDYCGEDVSELAIASLGYIETDMSDIKKRYISLGFHLHEMETSRYYEEIGYDDFYECIEKNFHMDKSAVSRAIAVWREFSASDEFSSGKMWIDDRYQNYSYSQLVEMLPLKDAERRKVHPDMTVAQIRDYKKSLKMKKPGNAKEKNKTPEEKISPIERGCITGKNVNGTCACCGNDGTVECCAQCKEDCNGRCGWLEEETPKQIEFPVMTNMQQREDFINGYKNWNVWCKNDCTEETFYRYDLPDGFAIVVKHFPSYPAWSKKECENQEYFLLKPGYRHFADCHANMTALKEHLKNMKK